MKTRIQLLLLIIATAMPLALKAQATAQPVWLETKIAEYKSLPPFNPPRSIIATKYDGKNVYYISPACCDIPSELYDEKGTLLCHPDGGFAGGDGRCRSFVLDSGPHTTVWRDERTTKGSSPSTTEGTRLLR